MGFVPLMLDSFNAASILPILTDSFNYVSIHRFITCLSFSSTSLHIDCDILLPPETGFGRTAAYTWNLQIRIRSFPLFIRRNIINMDKSEPFIIHHRASTT